ncbi:polysaccharide deacetylase family protein [Prosthecobacter sp. SYSU 5D2]|uniref:polysaccharide deacetylase family protein n=1 Tax=Prosthecobacter sp. SYSU 5D2 TaxID=3134134 RepID=UPI0031FE4645
MSFLPSTLSRAGRAAKSAALVLSGVAGLGRSQLAGEGAVLAFHGLRADAVEAGVGDEALHLPVSTFRSLCEHLAGKYEVMKLQEMAEWLARGEKLPAGAVAITFDDGYASNHELGLPVLKEFGLPATIFLTTGFLDRDVPLWFQQVDLAMGKGAALDSGASLSETLAHFKTLPDEEMRAALRRLLEKVPGMPLAEELPPVMRPMSWGQAREMQESGLVDFGGHTHTHPILARCTVEKQRREIMTCRERMRVELGTEPKLFAFPNGGADDFTEETLRLLAEAGFESAWTMMSGRASAAQPPLAMPRYGSPSSVWEAEATVSGAFELIKKWRGAAA